MTEDEYAQAVRLERVLDRRWSRHRSQLRTAVYLAVTLLVVIDGRDDAARLLAPLWPF